MLDTTFLTGDYTAGFQYVFGFFSGWRHPLMIQQVSNKITEKDDDCELSIGIGEVCESEMEKVEIFFCKCYIHILGFCKMFFWLDYWININTAFSSATKHENNLAPGYVILPRRGVLRDFKAIIITTIWFY